ncbi:response regulator receiver sensor signal transduction histidine kinase [Chondrocystis sp. NIES-4102]|nr:response regulator receiver sensor signal transduction histidine kinase [Chondrocystis sp. NIES-4102]
MLREQKAYNILIVDDHAADLEFISRILIKHHYNINTAIDGQDAIEKVAKYKPKLILLDIKMPRLNGFEACRQLKENPTTRDIPIILITALNDCENKLRGLEAGANDYIIKPFHEQELLARVKSHIQLFELSSRLKRKNALLKKQIDDKYETELQLLENNEKLEIINANLVIEIENRKSIEKELQQEIKERIEITYELKKSLDEKELLLKEIHHRVKNNLFIISSLLEMQGDYLDSPQIKKMVENSQNRLMSMALIHEQLYGDKGLSRIDFAQYLMVLTDNLQSSYLSKEINFTMAIAPMLLNIETATPCGLIINELITNAVEHAFPQRSQGNIFLNANKNSQGEITLIIKDDGVGFEDPQIFYQSKSLGMNLISTLVEQLEGKLEVKNNQGTEVTIIFKELEYQERI